MDLKQKFNEFFAKNNGKPVEVEDPTNRSQCMDLAFDWVDFLGIPRDTIRHLRAFQVYTQPTDSTVKYFELVPNTSNGVPEVGNLAVFDTGVGKSGHISIVAEGSDTTKLISFDQNWNGVQVAQTVTHNYDNVIGWLKPRQNCQEEMSKLNEQLIKAIQEREEKDRKYEAAKKEFAAMEKSKDKTISSQAAALALANQTSTADKMEINGARADRDKAKEELRLKVEELNISEGTVESQKTQITALTQEKENLKIFLAEAKADFKTKLVNISWLEFILAKIKG